MPDFLSYWAAALFGLSIAHVFSVKWFQDRAHRARPGSSAAQVFHLLGEMELVFALWSLVLIAVAWTIRGSSFTFEWLKGLSFTEPLFVLVIVVVAASRPVIEGASVFVSGLAAVVPLPRALAFLMVALTVGPLLGSFITEPAAMTVTALLLKPRYFAGRNPSRLYAIIAVLFVNVSIGGVLTTYAVPPVLMVASAWGWDGKFMLTQFGWRAVLAVILNAAAMVYLLRKEGAGRAVPSRLSIPIWIVGLHLLFLVGIVLTAHHPLFFGALFLLFVGCTRATKAYQSPLKYREAALVACFLGGLVILGSLQGWWLQPLLANRAPLELFLGATGLTALLDNAAITYLGAQVPDLVDMAKYALVAGAVTGGGLTIVANAPNPAGYSILRDCFGEAGLSPIRLLLYALPPTLVAGVLFWI